MHCSAHLCCIFHQQGIIRQTFWRSRLKFFRLLLREKRRGPRSLNSSQKFSLLGSSELINRSLARNYEWNIHGDVTCQGISQEPDQKISCMPFNRMPCSDSCIRRWRKCTEPVSVMWTVRSARCKCLPASRIECLRSWRVLSCSHQTRWNCWRLPEKRRPEWGSYLPWIVVLWSIDCTSRWDNQCLSNDTLFNFTMSLRRQREEKLRLKQQHQEERMRIAHERATRAAKKWVCVSQRELKSIPTRHLFAEELQS